MAAPVIFPPAATPIRIDAGVNFTYTIAATGQNALGFTPNDNFELTLSATDLTVKFTGPVPTVATIFNVVIFASNGEGTTNQTLAFEVQPPTLQSRVMPGQSGTGTFPGLRLDAVFTNGSTNIGTTGLISLDPFNINSNGIIANYSPNAVLSVGDIVYCRHIDGTPADLHFDNKVMYVVAVAAGYFRLANSPGGAAVSAQAFTGRYIYIGFGKSGTDTFFVGPTASLTVNAPISFAYRHQTDRGNYTWTVDPGVPSQLTGPLFVKQIVDAYHIKISTTVGGAAITASADYPMLPHEVDGGAAWAPSPPSSLIVSVSSQRFPNITSVGQTNVSTGGAVSYTITSDLGGVAFTAQSLPSFLSLAGAVISGTAPGSAGTYFVTLIATKGGYQYRRYWILLVSGGGTPPDPTGGNVPVISTAGGTSFTKDLGAAFAFVPSATNSPSSWVVSPSPPPDGLAFNSANGTLSGAFQAAGNYSFAFVAHNQSGNSAPVAFAFNVIAPEVTEPDGPTGGPIGGITLIDPKSLARQRGVDLILFADVVNKTLIGSPESGVPARLAPFFQGDNYKIDVYLLSPTGEIFTPYEIKGLQAGSGIRLGVGKQLSATGGSFALNNGSEFTDPIPYNATAHDVTSALMAITGFVNNWSTAIATGPDGGPWLIDRGIDGAVPDLLGVDVLDIVPDSVGSVQRVRAGNGHRHELQRVEIKQLAAAYSETWAPIGADGTVTLSAIQDGAPNAHAVQAAQFSQPPMAGTFVLIFQGSRTAPLSAGATPVEVQAAIDAVLGDGKVTVFMGGGAIVITYVANGSRQLFDIDTTNLLWNPGWTGEISFATLGVDQLLDSASEITDASLELEIAPASTDVVETVIQQNVSIKADLLIGEIYGATPNPTSADFGLGTVVCRKFTLDLVALQSGGANFLFFVNVVTIPAFSVLFDFAFWPVQLLAAPSLTAATAQLFMGSNGSAGGPLNVFGTLGNFIANDLTGAVRPLPFPLVGNGFEEGTDVQMQFSLSGNTAGALVAGLIDVWISYLVRPSLAVSPTQLGITPKVILVNSAANSLTTLKTVADNNSILVNGKQFGTDTNGGAFTLKLPPNPTHGQTIVVTDARGFWGTNNVTIDGNGKQINNNSTFICNHDFGDVTFTFFSGWDWTATT